ncbi:MAG: AAA family ATPase [Acutalibacteraceae bacterium]
MIDYIVALIDATRKHPMILRGASPRATLSLTAMAKAVAYVQRRDYVVPKDIQVTFPQVIAHRCCWLRRPERVRSRRSSCSTRSCIRSRRQDCKAMAKNRILYGLFLLAAVIFHSFYTGWFSFFLLVFAVLLPVFSLLVSLPAMIRAAYEAELPARCFCEADCAVPADRPAHGKASGIPLPPAPDGIRRRGRRGAPAKAGACRDARLCAAH